jgi:hypothetical protein
MTAAEDVLIQVMTTLIGGAIAVFVSFYFFRAQQKTDFNKLSGNVERNNHELKTVANTILSVDRTIRDVCRDLSQVKIATDVASVTAINSALQSLRVSYEKLNAESSQLATKIVEGLRTQQDYFLQRVQLDFSRTVETSKAALEQTLNREIAPLVASTSEQRVVVNKLLELTGYAMVSMGRYQLEAVKVQSSKALEESGMQVSNSIKQVHADVKKVKQTLDALSSVPVAIVSK